MANKPPPHDQNIIVLVDDYRNATTLQTSVNVQRADSYAGGYPSPSPPKCDSINAAAESATDFSGASRKSLLVSENADVNRIEFVQSVAPPYGWKRLHTNGIIIYVSPSNTALTSTEQVKAYLQTEGTCKCGLECPVNCDVTFNFSPKVLTRPWTAPVIGPGDPTKLCNHKRKLLTQPSGDVVDNRFGEGLPRKKRKVVVPQLSVSQLLSQREQAVKEQQSFNGLPWRENSQNFNNKTQFTNGYQDENQFRFQDVQYQRVHEESRFPQINLPEKERLLQIAQTNSVQANYEQRISYSQGPPVYEIKNKRNDVQDVPSGTQNLVVNRTPPWQQNKNVTERVPPFHPGQSSWSQELRRKQNRIIRKRYSEDAETREQPSFMDDPSGYLAQQTALLNSTISRQNTEGLVNKYSRPKSRNASRYPDSSLERRKNEEPSSTQERQEESPIQGATVSTSDRSPAPTSPDTVTTITMASGHTASSNTITSVLAGKANTATVTVNNQPPKNLEQLSPNNVEVKNPHIIVSNGQIIVNSMLSPQIQKSSSPMGQVLNQPILVNTLPGPLLLQPSVVVDNLNNIQVPQIMGNVVQNQVIEENLLSPDSKRKANYKKKKSPVNMLLSPQGNNVMVQQQINSPVLQAVTLVPSKTNFGGQQLITNMLQPLNLVQNIPIQHFVVPGVSGMVMSDGTILQDAVQLNLLPVQNNVFTSGQNLMPGMVIRPNNQNKVNNQFLNSPNQYLVNNTFSGQLSPMLSVSPNPPRNQEFLGQNVVVQQPNTSNTTVVQQNTTIVQQTTMVSNQQTQPTPTLNLNHQNFILNDKPNFILTSDKQNFILSDENVQRNFVLGNIDKQNLIINNMIDKKNSVSTQTQNQVLQISSSPTLVVATSSLCQKPAFSESPPDTTTLSPVDHEVTTSLQRTSPDQLSQLPMVPCISSSSQQAEGFLDNYNGGEVGNFVKSNFPVQSFQGKTDDFSHKMSLMCNVPDSVLVQNSENEIPMDD